MDIKTESERVRDDFLTAIETGQNIWPTFRHGMAVNQIVAATLASSRSRAWVDVADF